jgi:hypothetical protein
MKMREPPELDFAPEIPGVLARMVRLHLDTFGYSMGDFAKLVHVHEHHLPRYYDFSATAPAVGGVKLRIVR